MVLSLVFVLLPEFAMIKAVMKLEGTATSVWIPRLAPADHSERASEQLDAQTSWRKCVAVSVQAI